jgi:hypothetical protein
MEAVGCAIDRFDAARVAELDARFFRGVEQGVQDGAGLVGGGGRACRSPRA